MITKNTINLNNTSFNIPDSVTKGLTNLSTGAAVAAGIKAGASVAKSTGLSPAAKIGVITAGAVLAGSTVTVVNAINSINSSKVTTSEQAKTLSSKPPSPSNNPSSAFSVEPAADKDTILDLLNANYVLHKCITYLIVIILFFYIADYVLNNKSELLFIKRTFNIRISNLIIKWFTFAAKYNKLWIGITWFFFIYS